MLLPVWKIHRRTHEICVHRAKRKCALQPGPVAAAVKDGTRGREALIALPAGMAVLMVGEGDSPLRGMQRNQKALEAGWQRPVCLSSCSRRVPQETLYLVSGESVGDVCLAWHIHCIQRQAGTSNE